MIPHEFAGTQRMGHPRYGEGKKRNVKAPANLTPLPEHEIDQLVGRGDPLISLLDGLETDGFNECLDIRRNDSCTCWSGYLVDHHNGPWWSHAQIESD